MAGGRRGVAWRDPHAARRLNCECRATICSAASAWRRADQLGRHRLSGRGQRDDSDERMAVSAFDGGIHRRSESKFTAVASLRRLVHLPIT